MSNILIIGASSGIGKASAELLANAGHKVYGTFLKNEFTSTHPNIEYHQLDARDEVLFLDFLPNALSGLVYSVGSINLRAFNRLHPQDFTDDFNLHVVGAVKVIQAVLPRLRAAEHSSIVLFSTVAVQKGFPYHAQVSTSKGAIEGLTRALAAEFAPKIRVNAIAPSITDTPLSAKYLDNETKRKANAERHPMQRIGLPSDIAHAVNYLLSPEASWVTGQIFHIDGGMDAIKM